MYSIITRKVESNPERILGKTQPNERNNCNLLPCQFMGKWPDWMPISWFVYIFLPFVGASLSEPPRIFLSKKTRGWISRFYRHRAKKVTWTFFTRIVLTITMMMAMAMAPQLGPSSHFVAHYNHENPVAELSVQGALNRKLKMMVRRRRRRRRGFVQDHQSLPVATTTTLQESESDDHSSNGV